MKNFIIDTNIIINDPQCIRKFGKNNVIIPMVVLEEIDSFKGENSSRAGAARIATRMLDDLTRESEGTLYEGIKLANGGVLKVDTDLPDVDFTESKSKNHNDNILLQYTINMDEKLDNVELVTEDINLRVRAASLGIKAKGYQNTRSENDNLYDKVDEVHLSQDNVDELYSKGRVDIENFDMSKDLKENQSVIIKSNGSSCLGRLKQGQLKTVKKSEVSNVFNLSPNNAEQSFALDLLLDQDIKLVCLSGKAGVGKTILALAAGLQQTVNQDIYDKVTVARPTIAMGQELGFTPGTVEEKLQPWMAPIYDNIDYLYKKGHSKMNGKTGYQSLKQFDKIEAAALTYIRGRSITDEFVIIDELQNCSPHEIKTIVTRAAEGTKIVCTGDPYQIDNPYVDQYSNGLSYLIDRMEGEEIFGSINLIKGERSELAEKAAKML